MTSERTSERTAITIATASTWHAMFGFFTPGSQGTLLLPAVFLVVGVGVPHIAGESVFALPPDVRVVKVHGKRRHTDRFELMMAEQTLDQ